MNNEYLAHHGILGMKWGVRRFQNEDGSLTNAGKKRYMSGYTSNTTRKYEEHLGVNSKEAKASRELDKKLSDYYSEQSQTKTNVKRFLMGASGEKTYNMARSAGYSRGRSFAKQFFDVNVSTIADIAISSAVGTATATAADKIGAKSEKIESVLGPTLGNEINRRLGSTLGATVGHFTVGTAAAKKINETGKELSLQQQAIRKKYIKNHT